MIAIAIAAAVTHGVFFTGNDLYARCQERDQTTCIAYIIGLNDAASAIQNGGYMKPVICTDHFVTPAQERDVIFAYLRDHPAERNQEAGGLALGALRDAFPCR